MGLKTEVDQILSQSLQMAYRPPEAALGIAAHNIFLLTGGPAWVKGFLAYADTATGAASTFQVSACGVIMENAAVVCNLLIGEMAVWPLHGANVADVIVPNVAVAPYPPLASELLGMAGGIMISPGAAAGDLFILTVGAAIAAGFTSFFVYYYKMRPETLISPV